MNKLKIYLFHLLNRLLRETWEMIRHLLYPRAWIFLSPIIAMVMFFLNMKYWWLFVVYMFVSFILYDYDQGDWIADYRKAEKERLIRKAKQEKLLKEVNP